MKFEDIRKGSAIRATRTWDNGTTQVTTGVAYYDSYGAGWWDSTGMNLLATKTASNETYELLERPLPTERGSVILDAVVYGVTYDLLVLNGIYWSDGDGAYFEPKEIASWTPAKVVRDD